MLRDRVRKVFPADLNVIAHLIDELAAWRGMMLKASEAHRLILPDAGTSFVIKFFTNCALTPMAYNGEEWTC